MQFVPRNDSKKVLTLGVMKYYFWILGCAMNYSDAERISSVLDSLGYERTENEDEANLFFVISCSVRQSAINRIYGKIKDLKERKKKGQKLTTVLSGCVLDQDKKKLGKVFDIMFEINDLGQLPAILSRHPRHPEFTEDPGLNSSCGQNDGVVKGKSGEYLSIQPHYISDFRAYVPISTGCNNFCSYCAVPYTRGREKSRPMNEIVSEIRKLINDDYKEITLLGQNVNSYGHDITGNKKDNSPFIELISALDQLHGNYRIYFYSNHPKDMTDKLIETMATLKHFPHYIHLPLQSGNDEILQKMNRHNTKEQYLALVKKIRKAMPDVTLTTDIIVGYPGETEKQFSDTVEVMKKAKFDMAFIAQYSPRPGTKSAKEIDEVTKEEKRRREEILQQILAGTVLEHNQKLVGTTQKVLVDERKGDIFYGRTEGYKVVEIKTDQPMQIGQFIKVKIESAESWKLRGSISHRG
jgi:tRNA-2-methylthio-N6-dimethylallyladenosine synthase